jgi:hypothetical protein
VDLFATNYHIFFRQFPFQIYVGLGASGAIKINNSESVWMYFPLNFTHEVIFNFLDSSFIPYWNKPN